jgi:hypothetical protein
VDEVNVMTSFLNFTTEDKVHLRTIIAPPHFVKHNNYNSSLSNNLQSTVTMGYPDTFEGFMIESQKNWSDFKKKDVSTHL